MSGGKSLKVTDQNLLSNVQSHLNRLMRQLAELEAERSSLDEAEYAELKNETMEQLKELERTVDRVKCGDVTVVDNLSVTKMAIRSAISEAFRTPEIVAVFAKKQPALLRQKLLQIEADHMINKISNEVFKAKKCEILYALYKLNEKLSPNELQLVEILTEKVNSNYELASSQSTYDDKVHTDT